MNYEGRPHTAEVALKFFRLGDVWTHFAVTATATAAVCGDLDTFFFTDIKLLMLVMNELFKCTELNFL